MRQDEFNEGVAFARQAGEGSGMSPIKVAQLQQLRRRYASSRGSAQKLAVIAETVAMLGSDYYALSRDNASKRFPCPLLRQCFVVLSSL